MENIRLVVPDLSVGKYAKAAVWENLEIRALSSAKEHVFYARVVVDEVEYEIFDNQAKVYACRSSTTIEKKTLPDSIPYQGRNFPVVEVKGWSLAGFENLASVTLPAGLKSVGSYSFARCSSLESIVLPKGVEVIDESCFGRCFGLKSVTCLNPTPAELGEEVFYKLDLSTIKLYVPKGAVEAYKAADVWKEFDIWALPSSGVENVVADTQEGEPVIFDFQGRRVLNPRSGKLYIVNGKKMLWW